MRKRMIAPILIGVITLFGAEVALAQPAIVPCEEGDDPAAEINEFKIVNGVAQWHVSSEDETEGYVLEGANTAVGPWTQIGPMESTGSTDYSIDVSGSGLSLVRLVEIETAGTRRIYGVLPSMPAALPEPPLPSREELVATIRLSRRGWSPA